MKIHCRDGGGRPTLRYHKQEWWQWNGKCYGRVSIAEMKAGLSAFAKARIDKATLVGYKVKPQVTTGVVGNLLQALQSELLVPDAVEMPAWLGRIEHIDYIPVNNGLIDVQKVLQGWQDVLRSPSPEFFSQVALPVDYKPGATCPKFQNFLDEVLQGDAEAIAFLQEWFGYCLVTDTSLERFVILVGEGCNGKSVLLHVLQRLVGDQNASNVGLEVFGDRFQMTPMLGKLVNIAPEIDDVSSVAEGKLKAVVSGEPMLFDRKNLEPLQTASKARLIFATNKVPKFRDRSSGLSRRAMILPFNVTIPPERIDRQLKHKLVSELPGIFIWALDGLQRLRINGKFTEPAIAKAALEEHRAASNPTATFIREECVADPNGEINCAELYGQYRVAMAALGERPLEASEFGKEVKRAFPNVEKRRPSRAGDRPYVYRGVRWSRQSRDFQPGEDLQVA